MLLTRPCSGGGATPMLPKNGCSGITMPGANAAVIVFLSSGMIRVLLGAQLSGRNPRQPLYPYAIARSIDSILTSSASPGSAPSTYTGPVRM